MGKFGKTETKKKFMCKAFFFFACKLLHFKGPRPPLFLQTNIFAQLWTLSMVP